MAVNTVLVPLHILLVVVDILSVGTTTGETATVILLEVAVFGVAQPDDDVTIQYTESAFDRTEVVKVLLLLPVLVLFTFHWYTGLLPALVAEAVKVVAVPAQILLLPLIVIAGATVGLTVITTGADVPVAGIAHPLDDVSITRTVSLLLSAVVVNVLLLVPALVLFTLHW